MPAWLAAIPVVGTLFEKLGEAIDRNVTTDAERLQLKAELTSLYVPIVTAVIEAQKHANEMQVKLAEVEANSQHWLVWSRRPIIAFLAVGNFIAAAFLKHMDLESALYFAMLCNGLDFASRGVEKTVSALKSKERI